MRHIQVSEFESLPLTPLFLSVLYTTCLLFCQRRPFIIVGDGDNETGALALLHHTYQILARSPSGNPRLFPSSLQNLRKSRPGIITDAIYYNLPYQALYHRLNSLEVNQSRS